MPSSPDQRTIRACALPSRMPKRPTGWPSWPSSSRPRGPSATIEIQTTLGPVIGTHAGPGTVGFFWFQDG